MEYRLFLLPVVFMSPMKVLELSRGSYSLQFYIRLLETLKTCNHVCSVLVVIVIVDDVPL